MFKPTFLYIKQHGVTGKLYFGKTTTNILTYNGSGKRWQNHVNYHGKEHIINLWYCLYTNEEDLKEQALALSKIMGIVESKEFLNLQEENGLDGMPAGTKCEDRKGKAVYKDKDGNKFLLKTDDPIISELGLVHIRSDKQKSQAAEQARKNAQNKEMQLRKGKTMSTRKWFHNPETNENKRLLTCPYGWKEGRSQSDISNKDKEFWNDGLKNYMLNAGEKPQQHWIKGMKPRSTQITKLHH